LIELFETLEALKQFKTMRAAAVALRVSQSTVSKRIAQLENLAGVELLVRVGRVVELGPNAIDFLEQARPHLDSLKDLLAGKNTQSDLRISLAMTESIISSWGAITLKEITASHAKLDFHTHRGSTLLQKITSGQYHFGILVGPIGESGLIADFIGKEPFVICGLGKQGETVSTIEESSQTWKSISKVCKKLNIQVISRLETFVSVARMVNLGMTRGLIPKGVAREYLKKDIKQKPIAINRSIYLVYRKKVIFNSQMQQFKQQLLEQLKKDLARAINSD
jgi:DNA-binding transcriptional LysR family regulator